MHVVLRSTFFLLVLTLIHSHLSQRVRQPLELARRRGHPRETEPPRRERHRRGGTGRAPVASGWQATEPAAIDYKV